MVHVLIIKTIVKLLTKSTIMSGCNERNGLNEGLLFMIAPKKGTHGSIKNSCSCHNPSGKNNEAMPAMHAIAASPVKQIMLKGTFLWTEPEVIFSAARKKR